MKYVFGSGAGILATMALACGSACAKEPLEVGAKPEGMTRGFSGKLYISMMGETRTEGDGDGGITVIKDGKPMVFCEGMDDPKGIVMLGRFSGDDGFSENVEGQ